MQPQPFGRYLLLDKVAAGGMAEVWRAKVTGEASFHRIIAIKKILPHVAEDAEFITMFTDEALITGQLTHANIGHVYEFSRENDEYFIAMEYISGKDLKSIWAHVRARKIQLPVELSCFIIARVADGLDYAHSRRDSSGDPAGIIHRDVSPQNVLLSWEGDVKIIDFGIAKATEKSGKTRPGTLKGKFAYMSPEQIRGLPLDGRADVFALGILLYELVTAERAFAADSEFALLEMVRNVEIKPPRSLKPELPAELERIILKCLAKNRDQRHHTAADLSEDLQRFLLGQGRPPAARDLAAWMRQNFTVEFDKERSRFEGYKDVRLEDVVPTAALARTMEPADLPDDTDPTGMPAHLQSDRQSDRQSDPHSERRSDLHSDQEPDPGSVVAVPSPPQGLLPTSAASRSPSLSGLPDLPVSPAQRFPRTLTVALGSVLLTLVLLGPVLWASLSALTPMCDVTVEVKGPPRATIRLADRPLQTASVAAFHDTPPGAHVLTVEEPGWKSFTTTVVVPEEDAFKVTASLHRLPGRLEVTSEPSGALILIDRVASDRRTPAILELEGDSIHELRLRLDGYIEGQRDDVRVAAGGEQRVRLKLQPEAVRIHLDTHPPGAAATSAGKPLGITPFVLVKQPNEAFPVVRFTKKGCHAYETTVPFDREKADDHFELTLKCR